MIALIAAVSSNNIIGDRGRLPWHLPSDLRRFKELTEGHAVIMGRLTYESLPDRFRPLPNRVSVILSRNLTAVTGVLVANSLTDALVKAAEATPDRPRVFVVGGAQLYQQALPIADEIFLTRVEDCFAGDTRFPLISSGSWAEVERSGLMFENDCEFRFVKYERRAP
jgi:dihydrofolate reductase